MSPAAARVVAALTARRQSVACAESLTGGLVCAALTDVPGASAAVLGDVVGYATAVKATTLGVDRGLLAAEGAVHPEVARQMAVGVCRVLGSDWGVATTGVAGPEPQDGREVGTVYVAVAGPGTAAVRQQRLVGNRAAIRAASVAAALDLLEEQLALTATREEPNPSGG